MRISRIAAIGAAGVAGVIGAKKIKQARSQKKGSMPTEVSDVVEDGDSFLDSASESL